MLNHLHHFRRAALALLMAACAGIASAAGTLTVELDTSGYGSNGYIDIFFGSSPNSALDTSATLSNLLNWGSSADAQLSNVTGSLATGFTIQGDPTQYNDLFHAVDFSQGKVSFTVSFSGSADLSGMASSTMAVTLYGADGFTPLGVSSDIDGSLVHLVWTPAVTVGGQGSVAADVLGSGATVTAVPEAQNWAMMVAGLVLLGFMRRRLQG